MLNEARLTQGNTLEPLRSEAGLKKTGSLPRASIEAGLTKILCEVLRCKHIGLNENFLSLGRHALLVPRIIARVQLQLETRLLPSDLFDNPTIRLLAIVIERAQYATLRMYKPSAWGLLFEDVIRRREMAIVRTGGRS
ncbi:MAG: hypothetical protein KGJ37_01655 [Verrucomicrobiota bacterium]|nr:hypothetical protein [Verrucomicrobiota bacterium]